MNGNEVIDFLLTEGRAIMLETYSTRSCIAATVIGVEVCRAFGIDAKPLAVKADALNPAAVKVFAKEATGQEPNLAEATRLRRLVEEAGGYIVGIDGSGEVTETDWDGHLVMIATDRKGNELLVDLSADQMSRPLDDLRAKPHAHLLTEWPAAFVDHETGVGFVYRPMPTGVQSSWRKARDYKYEGRWRPVAGRIIRAIKERTT